VASEGAVGTDNPFRLYLPEECGEDGYPYEWHNTLKYAVREADGHRCLRCGHPYLPKAGEWSNCDDRCDHGGPIRVIMHGGQIIEPDIADNPLAWIGGADVDRVEARWRILTVHHLDGVKANCNWWNLVSLCQRDHLIIQRRVVMHREWPWEHTEWFKPYVAAFYAFEYLGENLTLSETLDRLDDLLAVGMEHARRKPWQDRLPV
jgi:hypothetical protein